jgi:hypothetical protein
MRYFIGFLVTIFLIITLIILLFSGGGKPKVTPKDLTSYASTDVQVRYTIVGPVVAQSLARSVRITVDRDNVTYEQINGYDGEVVNTQMFANTQNAYNVFLHALKYAGFAHGDNNPALKDETGRCATGQVYLYEVIQDGNDLQRYWSTSCGGFKTFLGGAGMVQTLFQAQVPNYGNVSSGVSL